MLYISILIYRYIVTIVYVYRYIVTMYLYSIKYHPSSTRVVRRRHDSVSLQSANTDPDRWQCRIPQSVCLIRILIRPATRSQLGSSKCRRGGESKNLFCKMMICNVSKKHPVFLFPCHVCHVRTPPPTFLYTIETRRMGHGWPHYLI